MAAKEVELKLKVAEAIQDDVNKGIVRVDSSLMNRVKVRPGDIVEIEGDRKTVAIIDRAYPGDIGLNIIRMDGIIRRNAKAGIGDMIKIRKADVKEAKKVIIAPSSKGVMIRASPQIFKQGLLGRALSKGDIVSLGGTKRRRTTMADSPFFEDMFSMLDESLMGFGLGDIKFIVADTNPKGAVVISELTEVVFNPDAAVVEEEKVLEVTYEDVGGLDEEIRKIREMVELPLKHPELFQRLGIEPPKGVLLHGAPGTGKTLLAKAVANETNSSFFLINGPEVMSKYYGQSLPAYEKIIIFDKGMLKRVPIGDVVDKNMKDVGVVCFDEMGKVVINKVTSLIKHKLDSKIFEIKTRTGRLIRATDYHSLFTLGDKGIESIKSSDLVANNSHIAIPKKIPFITNPISEINLLEHLKNEDYGIRIRNAGEYLEEAIRKLGHRQVSAILNIKEKYLYDILSKKVNIAAKPFLHLMDSAEIEIDSDRIQLCTKGKSFPCALKITENLCAFLGLWVAEGSYTNKNEVRLSIHRDEEKAVAQLCNELFGQVSVYRKPNSKGSDILICSGIVGLILKNLLGFNSGARNKRLPDLVYNLNKENLSAFLRGYISGDGSLNTKTPAPMIEISTESTMLADDIAYLLLYFGIVAKIYERKGRLQKRICFADYENLNNFLEIGFFDSKRNEFILKYIQGKRFSKQDKVPIEGEIKKIVDSTPSLHSWRNSKTIGRAVQEFLPRNLRMIFESDIYWDRVMSIKEIDEKIDFVYDISVSPGENFISGFGGIFAHNSEENLRKIFEDAEKNSPSIIFIDEVDAIAPKREEMRGDVERRVVAQLLALMDGLKSRGKVVVIAATNIPNVLDPALRRPGRFDREIEIAVPNVIGRENVLKIHTRNMPLSKDVDLKELALITHGFVGADLSALSKEAAMVLLRKILPDLKLNEEESIPKELLEKLIIAQKDFLEALKFVRPSAMREVLVEKPNVKWTDVGGLEEVKQELTEAVEWPLKNPESFRRLGIKPPKGILLYGAPGTGKTMLAKAVATETESNFILVKGPELLSKWLGESEKAVRDIFKKARQVSPTVICFDEIDALASKRGGHADSRVTESVVNQMLTEMDGLEELTNVVVIATTNRPDIIDSALLRPGRFDRLVLTPIPDEKMRVKIFEVHTKNMPIDVAKEDVKEIEKEFKNKKIDISIISKMAADEPVSEADLKRKREKITDFSDLTDVQKFLYYLAKKTEGYAGGDIEAVCREAAIFALREDMESAKVAKKHFEKALEKVRPSVTKEIEQAYNKIQDTLRVKASSEIKEKPTYFG